MKDGIATQAIGQLGGAELFAYLRAQRWFGGKADDASGARVASVIPLEWDNGAFAIALVSVAGDGRETQYQVPMAARSVKAESLPKGSVIASVSVNGSPVVLYDAVHDPRFRRGLADASSAGAQATAASGEAWAFEPFTPARLSIPPNAELRVAEGEQSNTSVVFDRAAILKLYRRVEPGVHPDVELSELLSRRAGFVHTPATIAVLRFTDARGATTIGGMVQELVPGARDGWTYFLEEAKGYFDGVSKTAGKANPSVGDAKRLGEITRAMHEALASDASSVEVAPEPASMIDLERWTVQTKEQIRRALALLDGESGKAKGDTGPEARALVGRRERYLAHVDELAGMIDGDVGARTRIHGDYHLGQVLRSKSGDFMVIDFEGEPGRPLSERRAKKSPLRDVAGMLRSFAYAAATLSKGAARAVDPATREVRAGRWERDVRAAFLDGYLTPAVDGGSSRTLHNLPKDPEHARRLIALFETEKAFFELAYELNNRPDWAWIPMRGIAKLLV